MTRTKKRTDIHRPAVIRPEDYEFVGFEYLKIEGFGDCAAILAEREVIRAHMDRTGGTYSSHQHGGNCHVCGAAAIYTVLFYHEATNSYVRTGQECAELLGCREDGDKFRRAVQDAREAAAGKRKAQALLDDAGLSAAWPVYLQGGASHEAATVVDIVGKLVRYGSISPAQTNYLRSLVDRIQRRPEIEAQRAKEHEAAAPLPITDRRVTICGTVVSVRSNDFGARMLVKHADGWKVWGSLPASLDSDGLTGKTVEFCATVKPSKDDAKFGFFSRPTKARVLTETGEA